MPRVMVTSKTLDDACSYAEERDDGPVITTVYDDQGEPRWMGGAG